MRSSSSGALRVNENYSVSLVAAKPLAAAVAAKTLYEAQAAEAPYAYFKNEYEKLKAYWDHLQTCPLPEGADEAAYKEYCAEVRTEAIYYYRQMQKHSKELALDTTRPVRLRDWENPAEAKLAIGELLVQLVRVLGIEDGKDRIAAGDYLEMSVGVILEEFGGMTLEMLAGVFKKAISGEFTIYGAITLPTVCGWLKAYKEELQEAWAELHAQQHRNSKGDDSGRREARYQIEKSNEEAAKRQRAKDEAAHKVLVREMAEKMRKG
jgi:hypothetical protein